MEPACTKMTLLVSIAVFALGANSQTEHGPNVGSSDSEQCVCQPHITINPPVCGRSVPVNSGTGCNLTTVQEILRTVTTKQDMVSYELQDIKRQLEMLQGNPVIYPKDCSEALTRGVTESGVYMVQPLDSGRPFKVYCDMETDGGGWTVFQRRKDGTVDFYLDFASYSRGFGDLDGEFWLGNEFLHRLTAEGVHELRVDLSDFDDNTRYAKYGFFRVTDVSDYYRVTVRNYSGNAGDSMDFHNNHQFSAKDLENDVHPTQDCAEVYQGAWWYSSCHASNLNGEYHRGNTTEYGRGVVWYYCTGHDYSLKTSEMKIRLA